MFCFAFSEVRWFSKGPLRLLFSFLGPKDSFNHYGNRASQVALVVKNPPANPRDIRDTGSISESGGFPGEGYGNPLQCSCLANPMDRGAWWATILRVAKSRIWLKRLSMHRLWKTLWSFLKKTKNRVAIWSSNPTPGHIPRWNCNSKDTRTLTFIAALGLNSQVMETA